MLKIYEIISTVFFCGRTGFAPGTFGSLCGLVAISIAIDLLGFKYTSLIIFALLPIFTYAAHKYAIHTKTSDPKEIVIDEFVGISIVMLICHKFYANTINNLEYIVLFITFRFFDIVKPWPIRVADKKIKGGVGIMLDDILAATFTILAFVIFKRYLQK